MDLAVMVTSADPVELRNYLRCAHETGFGAIQLWARYPAGDAEWMEIRRETERLGLQLVALGGYASPLSSDEGSRTASIAELRSTISRAQQLGVGTVVTWSGTRAATMFDDHPDNVSDSAMNAAVAHFREVANWAESAGVTVAIEPFHNHVARTPERLRDLVDAVNSPCIRCVMDPPNFLKVDQIGRVNSEMPAMFSTLGNRIALVHAKDLRLPHPGETTRVIGGVALPHPGDGIMDYALYGRLIREYYQGPVVVEHITEETMGPARNYVIAQIGEANA